MTDQLLTVQEVMQRLNISRATLYRLMDDGKLASVKLRGSRRFKASELARYLASLDQPG